MADQKATLTIGKETYDFAVRDAAVGPSVIDISTLYKNTDCFTFDPGFTSTAACESALTYIDGDAGILLHRGYPIDQLADARATSWRPAICCCTANCRSQTRQRPNS